MYECECAHVYVCDICIYVHACVDVIPCMYVSVHVWMCVQRPEIIDMRCPPLFHSFVCL